MSSKRPSDRKDSNGPAQRSRVDKSKKIIGPPRPETSPENKLSVQLEIHKRKADNDGERR
jgi:hypothetical protein